MEYVAVVGVEAMMAAMVSKVENVVTKYLEEILRKEDTNIRAWRVETISTATFEKVLNYYKFYCPDPDRHAIIKIN